MTLEARAEGTAEKPDINEEIITQLQNAAVGDSVIFGSYEQDNEISNGFSEKKFSFYVIF